jgi:hypothetical protein
MFYEVNETYIHHNSKKFHSPPEPAETMDEVFQLSYINSHISMKDFILSCTLVSEVTDKRLTCHVEWCILLTGDETLGSVLFQAK